MGFEHSAVLTSVMTFEFCMHPLAIVARGTAARSVRHDLYAWMHLDQRADSEWLVVALPQMLSAYCRPRKLEERHNMQMQAMHGNPCERFTLSSESTHALPHPSMHVATYASQRSHESFTD
jgi:hypothetical protein